MWHLRDIFVSGTYLAIVYEVALEVGCILVDMGKMFRLYVNLAQWLTCICNKAAIFIFSDVCQICVE